MAEPQTQTPVHQRSKPPTFDFIIDESLEPWNLPMKEWLTQNDKHWDGLATNTLVFNSSDRLLVVQRASHDSMPNRWEVPGGAVDPTDASILHGAARELWEEACLVAKRVNRIVTEPGAPPGYVFPNRTGRRLFCRFSFEVEVESCEGVELDANEHRDFAWVTEREVREGKSGERVMRFTNGDMVRLLLEGFRLRTEGGQSSGGS